MLRLTVRTLGGPAVHYSIDLFTVSIGRDPQNALVIDDSRISHFHAEIRASGKNWVLRDRGSRNGTRVNGQAVAGETLLRPSDEIGIGAAVLVFDGAVAGAVDETQANSSVSRSHRGTPSVTAAAMIGSSAVMEGVRRTIRRAAAAKSTILIVGESGAGKEVAARLLHSQSPRAARPFVVVNCPALPVGMEEAELFGVEKQVATGVAARLGLLETAEAGTLLFDEVGDLPPPVQAKLLRFLQDHTVERIGGRSPKKLDVRVLAATNRDLAADVEAGKFRSDLLFRLNVITIALPPLRARPEDIPELVRHFLELQGEGRRISGGTLAVLSQRDWPGNVRELQNAVERAAALCEGSEIGPEDFPEAASRHAAAAGTDAGADIASLYRRLVTGSESFWTLVREPFLRRQLPPAAVRALIARAYDETGSYKEVARLFGIEADHKRFLDFLGRHRLRPRDARR